MTESPLQIAPANTAASTIKANGQMGHDFNTRINAMVMHIHEAGHLD